MVVEKCRWKRKCTGSTSFTDGRPNNLVSLRPCDLSLSLRLFHLTVTLPRTLAFKICGTSGTHGGPNLLRITPLFQLVSSLRGNFRSFRSSIRYPTFRGSVFRYPPILPAHSSIPSRDRTRILRFILSQISNHLIVGKLCIVSSFRSLVVIFDRSRALLLVSISVKKISAVLIDRLFFFFFFFLNPN